MAVRESNAGSLRRLYVNGGTQAAPSWTEIKDIEDISDGFTGDVYSTASRGQSYGTQDIAMNNYELTGTLHYYPSVTTTDQLEDAARAQTALEFYAPHKPLSMAAAAPNAAKGFRFWGKIVEWPIAGPLKDGQKVNFKIVPVKTDGLTPYTTEDVVFLETTTPP